MAAATETRTYTETTKMSTTLVGVTSKREISVREAQILLFLGQCHTRIMESVHPRGSDCAFKATPISSDGSSATDTTHTIALRLLGDSGRKTVPEDVYKPAIDGSAFRLYFRGKSAKASKRNIVQNIPELLDAVTRSFGSIPCIDGLLQLLREEEAVKWDHITDTDANFGKLIAAQSRRHRDISSRIHYLRSIAVLGTEIGTVTCLPARSQCRKAPRKPDASTFSLSAAHHALLAESTDDYPEILAQRLFKQFEELASAKDPKVAETSETILDLIAIGVSYEDANDLLYQVCMETISPEAAIRKLKEELLSDFYSVLPDTESPTEGAIIGYKSPLYFISQLTTIAPETLNAVDCVLERGKVAFHCDEVPDKEWSSVELAPYLYTLLGHRRITPERSLEILGLFMEQLIAKEHASLERLQEARENLVTGVEELLAMKPLDDTEAQRKLYLMAIHAKILILGDLSRALEECYDQLSEGYKDTTPASLLLNSNKAYAEGIKLTRVTINIAKNRVERVISIMESQELKQLIETQIEQCRNHRKEHEIAKRQDLAKVIDLEAEEGSSKTEIAELRSQITLSDKAIAKAVAREEALNLLLTNLRDSSKMAANIEAIASLLPSYAPTQPIESILNILSSKAVENITDSPGWKNWVTKTEMRSQKDLRVAGEQLIAGLPQSVIMRLHNILEHQKVGFMAGVRTLRDGKSRPQTDHDLLRLGRALRASSIPFNGITMTRSIAT